MELNALSLLQAEKSCRDLVVSAVDAIDRQDYEALVDLFTSDAILVRPGGVELHGYSEILASYQARDPNRITHHLICQQHIQVHPSGAAQSRCKVLLYTSNREYELTPKGRLADVQHQVGAIVDELVLTDIGWKIRARQAWFDLFTSSTVALLPVSKTLC